MKNLFNLFKRTDSFASLIFTTIIIFTTTQSVNAQINEFIPASDTNIRYSGRIDDRDPGSVFFAYPGISIKVRFEGTSISAFLMDYGTNFFNIIIDGGTPTVLSLSKTQTLYELASGLADGIHTVEIFKRTETSVGKVAFKGFVIDAGKKLLPLDPPASRKIEFIGNSITCGYGNEVSTNNPNNFHFTPKNEDNYKAWGAVAARTLNAEYSCIAYSGRGLYQNYDGEKTGTLPLIYDYVNADESGLIWNHYNYTPDVIVINLGTNDFSAEISSAANTVDSAVFASTYVSFINKLRSYYPNASIICCVGVMMSDSYPSGKYHWTRIQKYVSSVRNYFNNNGDSKVYYLKLEPQTGPYGEDWHPTAATDQKMATALVNFINTNINWEDCPRSVDLGKDINLKYSVTPVILNANTSENAESSLSWYKNDILISGATVATYQIDDTTGASGVYKVVKDSAQCKYEDIVIVENKVITDKGIDYNNFSFYQTKSNLMFSIVATDDSQIVSVKADLTPVNGQQFTTLSKMDADSFYVSIPASGIPAGSKIIMFTITDNDGNIVRFCESITVKNLSVSVDELNDTNQPFAYPVPTKGLLNVSEIVNGTGIVEVLNNQGINCFTANFDSNKSKVLDLSLLSPGIYFIMLSTETGKLTQKIVIE